MKEDFIEDFQRICSTFLGKYAFVWGRREEATLTNNPVKSLHEFRKAPLGALQPKQNSPVRRLYIHMAHIKSKSQNPVHLPSAPSRLLSYPPAVSSYKCCHRRIFAKARAVKPAHRPSPIVHRPASSSRGRTIFAGKNKVLWSSPYMYVQACPESSLLKQIEILWHKGTHHHGTPTLEIWTKQN